jgi:MATE family multidrug resistance protein
MGTTDVMMMGWLSTDTLAAGTLGANLYFMAFVFGAGLLNAATPMIARDLGRDPGTSAPIRGTVRIGLWSALVMALPLWLALWWSERLLLAMGEDPGLSVLAGAYVHTLQWALLPAWGFIVLRSFISALERPGWSLAVGLTAVGLNATTNWPRPICGRPPPRKGCCAAFDQIACVHMSGLLSRSQMSAGQDGFRDGSS